VNEILSPTIALPRRSALETENTNAHQISANPTSAAASAVKDAAGPSSPSATVRSPLAAAPQAAPVDDGPAQRRVPRQLPPRTPFALPSPTRVPATGIPTVPPRSLTLPLRLAPRLLSS
jgi:hypothetical protein